MRYLRSLSIVLFAGCMVTLVAELGRSQPQLGTKGELLAEFKEAEKRRVKLAASDSTEKLTASDKKVADALAKWYIHRITHKGNFEQAKVHEEFAKFTEGKRTDLYQQFIDKYLGLAMVSSMKEVFDQELKEHPSIFVNACMMLPTMAKLRSDDVGDYLDSLVNSGQANDVMRLYALRGLKEFMPIGVAESKKARDIKSVDTLTKFIERPVKLYGMAPEQVAVVHYFRREAIASLAHAGAPAVVATKKQLEGSIAPTLLKVLAKDALQPPPNLQERIEAAVGLCSMKYPTMPEYLPDVSVYLVGLTLKDMVDEYKRDLPNFSGKGKDRKLSTIAWKAEGKRLEQGLKDLKENAKSTGAKTNADLLESLGTPILKSIQKYEDPGIFDLNAAVMSPKWRQGAGTGAVYKSAQALKIELK